MKEYWINVYKLKNGRIEYGNPYESIFVPTGNLKNQLLYRIHVRLK